MADSEPIMLELAQLPREKLGPFFLLGLHKTASQKDIDAHWALRLKWARKNQISVALEDINWARDCLNDKEKRVEADVASLTTDLADDFLYRLALKYSIEEGQAEPSWEPLDEEHDHSSFEPAVAVPTLEEVKQRILMPDVPEEMPSCSIFLTRVLREEIDPWALNLANQS